VTGSLATTEWVDVIDREYLGSFVAEGGASVKFAVPLEGASVIDLVEQMERRSFARNFLVLKADAADVKVHMVDQLFFRLSEQIPWAELARDRLLALAKKDGYTVNGGTMGPVEEVVASTNGLEPSFVRNELRRRVQEAVFKDHSMAKDFRVAMTQLCLAQLSGGEEGDTTTRVLTQWLTGQNRAVGAVKPYQIRTRIMRTNARLFIESLLAWVRSCDRNPKDERVFYAKAALLDTYEVLRQFIDATDRLDGCLLLVITAPEFLETEPGTRGMGAYEALMFRVYDEVRDRTFPNPMASLVRLEGIGS
jgi:hypothetical protein